MGLRGLVTAVSVSLIALPIAKVARALKSKTGLILRNLDSFARRGGEACLSRGPAERILDAERFHDTHVHAKYKQMKCSVGFFCGTMLSTNVLATKQQMKPDEKQAADFAEAERGLAITLCCGGEGCRWGQPGRFKSIRSALWCPICWFDAGSILAAGQRGP